MSLSDEVIDSLKDGDFAGLTNLTRIDSSRTGLTMLPPGIFAGLTNLRDLDLSDNPGSSTFLPIAIVELPRKVNAGAEVTLNGIAISQSANLPAGFGASSTTSNFAWTQTEGSPMVKLTATNTATLTFIAPTQLSEDTELTFRLTVTDSGRVSSATTTITVLRSTTKENIKTLNEAIVAPVVQTMLASTIAAVGGRVDAAFSGAPSARYLLDGQTIGENMQGTIQKKLPIYLRSLTNGTMDWKRILGNSSFTLPLNATDSEGANPSSGLAVWGSGNYKKLSSKDDVDWNGDVFGVQLGIDKRVRNDLLVGGMVSYSKGDIDYTQTVGNKGKYTHKMTSIHPYLAWTDGEASLWGSVGYGQGKLEIKRGDLTNSTGTNLLSLAGGAKKQLPTQGLSIKGDVSLAKINIKQSSNLEIDKQRINSQRLRLLLETERQPLARANGVLTPVLEIGVRYDGGSGNKGFGAVFGAGINYTNADGLTVQGKANATLGQNKYTEWGVSGTIRLQPGADGQGLSISLIPSYGRVGNSAERLWQSDAIHVANNQDDSARIESRIGYGFPASGGGLLTPYGEMTVGNYNRYALGMRWQPNPRFDLNLLGEHAANNRILLESRIRF